VNRSDLERERDVEELRRVALAQHAQIEQLVAVLKRKCDELAALKGSEGELQQTLALVAELTCTAQAAGARADDGAGEAGGKKKERASRSTSGPTPQPNLAVIEKEFELDEADRACPSCGGRLDEMPGQFETSEMIDVVEVSYRVVQVKQKKYVCRCGGCVETAPGPERAIPGGRYSIDFALKVALDKYLDHIPLARQERIMARHGLDVSSQTLWDQLWAIAQPLRLVDDALFAHVLGQPVIGLDQTGWPRLDGSGAKPWQIWCLTAPRVVVHRIRDDKSAATFKELVGGYRGVIVCDALKTHAAGARDGPGIVLAGCWAHVFRKFEEAAADHPEATFALERIGALYDLDALAADDLEERAELRRRHSADVLDILWEWLAERAVLRSLSIGNAVGYTIDNWQRLTRFRDDPRIPLDNNATERGIRGPVVGRKNHYGSKSRRGTEVAARLYTLIETAKLHDLDPAAYLAEAVRRGRRGEILLPWDFAPRA
jgi:transposase